MKQFETDINKLRAAIMGCEDKLGMSLLDGQTNLYDLSHETLVKYYRELLEKLESTD